MTTVIPKVLTYPYDCAPSTFQDELNAIATYIQWTTPDYFQQVISGSKEPSADEQQMLWLKLGSSGKPLGLYWNYGGYWRPVYSGKTFELTMFAGDPNIEFDNTGLGKVGGAWDGWALCNGNNGTTDMRNSFLLCGTYSATINGWGTTIDPATDGAYSASGGNAQVTIGVNNLPALEVGGSNFQFNGVDVGGGNTLVFSLDSGSSYAPKLAVYQQGVGYTGENIPINLLPPYICVAVAQFVGY